MDYSPSEFYTHATDKKGHTVQYRIAFPPNVADQIAQLAADSKYPEYRTAQHVIRDAVFHRLAWLDENGFVELDAFLSTWQVQILIEREKERHTLGRKIIQDVNYIRLNARADSDKARLKHLLSTALQSDLPEDVRLELLRITDSDI